VDENLRPFLQNTHLVLFCLFKFSCNRGWDKFVGSEESTVCCVLSERKVELSKWEVYCYLVKRSVKVTLEQKLRAL
jgi:hypothetical protein